jgi:hypothetical protein
MEAPADFHWQVSKFLSKMEPSLVTLRFELFLLVDTVRHASRERAGPSRQALTIDRTALV